MGAIHSNEDYLSGCLLPEQYQAITRSKRYLASEAERKLLLAVLADAVHICLSCKGARTRQRRVRFEEARRWFLDETGPRAAGGLRL